MIIAKHARTDGSVVLVLSGEFDIASAPDVRRAGLELIAADGCTRFLVDLTALMRVFDIERLNT